MLYSELPSNGMEQSSLGGPLDFYNLQQNDIADISDGGYTHHDVETASLVVDTHHIGIQTYHLEAYYLYFIAIAGMVLNLLVVVIIIVRRTMRKLTSAFLIHACFLDFLKAAYCIPIGNNLLSQVKPSDCDFVGATYVLITTAAMFNLLAMVTTEAYTFGEVNIGGDPRGSICCILFGMLLVYIATIILHLGPTLIGGYFEFHPEIGSCQFVLGKKTGYVANVMWILIISFSVGIVIRFICKLYQEIQVNHTNRVSMLVRSSITLADDPFSSACNIQTLVNDSSHRAKIFILSIIAFIICWYPLYLLILVDVPFRVSPKVYQAFSFIAWSHGTVQPIIYICFDRHVNLLASYFYCDRYRRYQLPPWAQPGFLRGMQQSATEQTYDHDNGNESETNGHPESIAMEDSITVSIEGSHDNTNNTSGLMGGSGHNSPQGCVCSRENSPSEYESHSNTDDHTSIRVSPTQMANYNPLDTDEPIHNSYHNLTRNGPIYNNNNNGSFHNFRHGDSVSRENSHSGASIRNISC